MLMRGLHWIVFADRLDDGINVRWESRIGGDAFGFDPRLRTRAFDFGNHFRCAVGTTHFGERWHITFLDRVHLAVAAVDETKVWRQMSRGIRPLLPPA